MRPLLLDVEAGEVDAINGYGRHLARLGVVVGEIPFQPDHAGSCGNGARANGIRKRGGKAGCCSCSDEVQREQEIVREIKGEGDKTIGEEGKERCSLVVVVQGRPRGGWSR